MEILLWSGSTASDHGYEHLSHEAMKMIFCLLTKCPTMQTAQLTHRLPPPWAMVTQNCVSWKIRRYSTGTVCKYIQIHHTHIYIYIHIVAPMLPPFSDSYLIRLNHLLTCCIHASMKKDFPKPFKTVQDLEHY